MGLQRNFPLSWKVAPSFGAESSQRHAPRRGRTGFESALRRAEQLRALRRAVRASVSLPEVSAARKSGALAVAEDARGCGNLLF